MAATVARSGDAPSIFQGQIPASKLGDWRVVENIDFGMQPWNPRNILVGRGLYRVYVENAFPQWRKKFIQGKDIRKFYPMKKEERLVGGAFHCFMERNPEILQSQSAEWFSGEGDEENPFVLELGTEFRSKEGVHHWMFWHKRPDGKIAMGYKAADAWWPTSSRVLYYRYQM